MGLSAGCRGGIPPAAGRGQRAVEQVGESGSDIGRRLESYRMRLTLDIPGEGDSVKTITAPEGSAIVFCGANGSGKTRLAVHIEDCLGLQAHRISAHRALQLNPTVPRIDGRAALAGLRAGHPRAGENLISYRQSRRWNNNAAVALLDDFDYLVQVLFAEQANTALTTHKRNRAGDYSPAKPTIPLRPCTAPEGSAIEFFVGRRPSMFGSEPSGPPFDTRSQRHAPSNPPRFKAVFRGRPCKSDRDDGGGGA